MSQSINKPIVVLLEKEERVQSQWPPCAAARRGQHRVDVRLLALICAQVHILQTINKADFYLLTPIISFLCHCIQTQWLLLNKLRTATLKAWP